MIPSFGEGGVVDLKKGAVFGKGQQIDLETGEIGLHSTPTVVKDVVIVGSSFKEGMTVKTHNNTKGLVRAFDVKSGKMLWTFNTIPGPGEFGNDTLGERVVGDQRQHRASGPRSRLTRRPAWSICRWNRRPRTSTAAIAPATTCTARPGLRRPEDRSAQVALPDRAPSDLGLRPVVGADPARHQRQRQADQGGGAPEQGSLPLRVRPHHRPAGVADRREAGAAVRRAGREDVGDAAVPDQAAGVRAAGRSAIDDLIDFTPELNAEARQIVSRYKLGPMFLPGVVSKVEGTDRGADDRDDRGRHQLARRGGRSGNAHRLRAGEQPLGGADRPRRAAGRLLRHPLRRGHRRSAVRRARRSRASAARPMRRSARGTRCGSWSRRSASAAPPARCAVGQPCPRLGSASGTAAGRRRRWSRRCRVLPLSKPPYSLLNAIDLDKGELKWQVPHGDTPDAVRNSPLLKGMNIPEDRPAGQRRPAS